MKLDRDALWEKYATSFDGCRASIFIDQFDALFDDIERQMGEHGWNYVGHPEEGKDARKLVTLHANGMKWVGVRAWHSTNKCWMNNGEPERDEVRAWMNLPEPCTGFWDRGILKLANDAATSDSSATGHVICEKCADDPSVSPGTCECGAKTPQERSRSVRAIRTVPARSAEPQETPRPATLLEELRIESAAVENRRGQLYALAADEIERQARELSQAREQIAVWRNEVFLVAGHRGVDHLLKRAERAEQQLAASHKVTP